MAAADSGLGFSGKMKEKVIKLGERIKKVGEDDPRRIVHSVKVGLAVTLVSSFYYCGPLYDSFGAFGIWALITVVFIFEFTVGATLNKGLNRGLGTLLACLLAVGAHYLTNISGPKQPFIVAIFVFLIASAGTFSRFIPAIKAKYDYGVLAFILTFSMVSVSSYRVEELLTMAHQRIFTILAGGAICIIISIFVFPVWAGESLHNSVSSNIDKLANYLQGFGGEYFKDCDDHRENVAVTDKDKLTFLHGYETVINSKSTEDSLANFARWEPGHGKFGYLHPWKQYLKIGAFTRHCACRIEALHSYLNPSHHHLNKNAKQFGKMIKEPCKKMSSESGKALKVFATAMKTMTTPPSSNIHLDAAKSAIKDLKSTLQSASSVPGQDLLAIIPDATVASILIEIVKTVENICESVSELGLQARFKSMKRVSESVDVSHVAITVRGTEAKKP